VGASHGDLGGVAHSSSGICSSLFDSAGFIRGPPSLGEVSTRARLQPHFCAENYPTLPHMLVASMEVVLQHPADAVGIDNAKFGQHDRASENPPRGSTTWSEHLMGHLGEVNLRGPHGHRREALSDHLAQGCLGSPASDEVFRMHPQDQFREVPVKVTISRGRTVRSMS
jgi:hypothetical protein